MRRLMIAAALATSVVALAAVPASALVRADSSVPTMAANDVTPADYYYRRHHDYRRYHRGGWVPYRLRGYADPGYAYHGNINGCAEDLGYGRWEPCDRGR
jgi:hypothetical protein